MTSKVDPELIRELAALLNENDLTEIEWSEGDRSVRVVRSPAAMQMVAGHAAPMPSMAAPPPAAATVAAEAPAADHPGAVRSPMVGTAYTAPEPGAKPFVQIGDRVNAGQTLLIIEAMKTMNPIPATRAGVVRSILTADGTPVEYGQVLMIIE